MSHTPAPWKVGEQTDILPVKTIEISNDSFDLWIAQVQVRNNGEANARLIAAAPEMLEALKHITEEMELADFDPEDTDTWYGRALAIIAKATGGAK